MARFYKPQKKTLNPKHQLVDIVRFDHHGDGVGFLNNKPVFVAGALPNEQVLVQLTEDKRQFSKGKLMKVVSASPMRCAPFCPHYNQCGGCSLQHISHDEQLALKQAGVAQLMHKFAGVAEKACMVSAQAPIVTASSQAYRRCARIAVNIASNGALALGFRKRNSSDIINIDCCPLLAAPLQAVMPKLSDVMNSLDAKRQIGHVELVAADNGNLLLVRVTQTLKANDIERLTQFAAHNALSLFIQQQDDLPVQLTGEAPFYRLNNLTLKFQPQDFIQINAEINCKMVNQAIDWLALNAQDRLLDLFCGLGNFSLAAAAHVEAVVGVEGVADMVARARENAEQNQFTNVEFYHADLEQDPSQATWAKQGFTKVLLDPARAGAFGVMPYVVKLKPQQVLYISCDPVTLARDSNYLLENGYQLAKLGVLDMFPHTAHVESMALFTR